MNKPSSQGLSCDFPCYKGLTLPELKRIVVMTVLVGTTLGSVIGMLIGAFSAFCIGSFFLSLLVSTLLLPKKIAKLKEGKPQGYLLKKMHITLSGYGLFKCRYDQYVGMWSKSKRIGGNDV